jgi:predicted ATP-grasp superfamily ATP-dependent carboligase
MLILLAEYASALGLGGTCELEGRAMLSTLARSFQRLGHQVCYPSSGQRIGAGQPIFIESQRDFEDVLGSLEADAGLLIAPDDTQAHLLEILEGKTVNLGCIPQAAELCADKLLCTQRLKENRVPVADIVAGAEARRMGCSRYVIKPRFGCGSEGVSIVSKPRAPQGYIVTRYLEGLHLSASFIAGREGFLPLTINRQIIKFQDEGMSYQGSQVPYRTPRSGEIWQAAELAALVLGLEGYAGIDFVVGDLPRVVDVNARPTTSIVGIARVMKEELGDLILKARFGGLPEKVTISGECSFTKDELSCW